MSEVYALADPATGEIRYVGKTVGTGAKRLRDHVMNARRGNGRQRRLWSWMRSLSTSPALVVLERDPVGDLDDAERAWIATLRRYGCRLTNMTPGGDGQAKGYRPSAETRAKTSAALKGRVKSEAERIRLRVASSGRRHSSATREKISAAHRGIPSPFKRVWTPELRERALAAYGLHQSAPRAASEVGIGQRAMYEFLRSEGAIIPKTERRGWRHTAEAREKMSAARRDSYARRAQMACQTT